MVIRRGARAVALIAFVIAVRANADELPSSTPEAQGFDSEVFNRVTERIANERVPIYSLLISRHGRLVYELYTSSLHRDDAHYLMSVTKSVVSLLVGIAIDRHLIRDVEQPTVELLPKEWFPSEADRARFQRLTVKQLLGMSALDAQVLPHEHSAEAAARSTAFWQAPNRVRFALSQKLLPQPGVTFQYTDITPMIAIGALQSVTGKTALEFAGETLFRPLGFRNVEWMHQDEAGFDNGGFGLRLRPIDMQKLGILLLRGGDWNGRRVVSTSWIERSLSPWIRSRADRPAPDYGWYFWQVDHGGGFVAHEANGWKGQRIAVLPRQDVVVTMTGCLEGGSEDAVFQAVVQQLVAAALRNLDGPLPDNPAAQKRLAELLAAVNAADSRLSPFAEWRMIPQPNAKERRRAFVSPPLPRKQLP